MSTVELDSGTKSQISGHPRFLLTWNSERLTENIFFKLDITYCVRVVQLVAQQASIVAYRVREPNISPPPIKKEKITINAPVVFKERGVMDFWREICITRASYRGGP
jgi:hypothetical protein